MKGKVFGIVLLFALFASNLGAEEIKYGFTKGATYTYEYSKEAASSATAPVIAPLKQKAKEASKFSIKCVGFQDNAYILDIGNDEATYRRYLANNGSLKGTPSEDPTTFPFFITFPEGDWRVGSSVKQNSEINLFGQKIPVIWNLTFTRYDKYKDLAVVKFETSFGVSDTRNFTRKMALSGEMEFNRAEGVIQKAGWTTKYFGEFIAKEIAVVRDLWTFEKQTKESLNLVGVEK